MENEGDLEEKVVKIRELDLNSLYPRHVEDYKGGSKYVVIGKPGCLEKGTKVLMFDGSIKDVEDVLVGDELMGDDSQKRKVLQLCRGYDRMYTIHPKYGEKYTVNKDHILSLKYENDIIDISVRSYLSKNKDWKTKYNGFYKCTEYEEKNTDLDPWLYGFLYSKIVNRTIVIRDKYLATTFEEKLNSNGFSWIKNKFTYILQPITNSTTSSISYQYTINSIDKRYSLLSGIVDRIGQYDKLQNGYYIFHKSKQYIDDIYYTCRSLGLECRKKQYTKKKNYNGNSYKSILYSIFIKGYIPVVSLKKKQEHPYKNTAIEKIKIYYKGMDNYYGFVLDGNHRFLLRDYTVTHNTGKSTLIKSILYSKKHILPVGKVYSGTEDSNGFFGEIMPKSFIENGLDLSNLSSIENFKRRQKLARAQLETRNQYPWSFLVIDDCSSDNKLFKKPIFQETYKNGRHWAMMKILSLQYCLDIPPAIRTCIDGTFILREPSPVMRKKLYENFGGCVDTFTDWNDLMDQLTDNYCAMFIDNKSKTNNLEDSIFFFRADPQKIPADWKIGCREYWDFHNERYDFSLDGSF